MASSVSAAKQKCLFWKQPYQKTSISQTNAWEAWFSSERKWEQIWRAVMSLFCPQRSQEPVIPAVAQRKGKPAFPAVLATWGGTTKGWESSTVIPIEHCMPPLYPAKRHDFCCWTAPSGAVKNYLQLSLHKNTEEAYGRTPSSSNRKTSFSLPVTLKPVASNGWSSSHFSCKRQECKLHVRQKQKHFLSESSPAAWQWSCFVPFIDDLLSDMSEIVLLSYWLLLPLCLWSFPPND